MMCVLAVFRFFVLFLLEDFFLFFDINVFFNIKL